jgi:hypothetical protein
MKALIKAALFALPVVLVLLLLRWLSGGEAERWRDRVEPHCPGAVVGIDEKGLIVVAPDREQARAAAEEVREFRKALAARYESLLGKPRFARMVVVVFPSAEDLQAYAGAAADFDRGAEGQLDGYTDPKLGAVFVPADGIETLRHETVHWFMETARDPTGPRYSPWLSEGIAQLFETLDPLAVPPRPPGIGPLRLPHGIDVDRLIHIEEYGEFLEEGQRNYREALALAAFLFETRPEQLRKYADAERKSSETRPLVFRGIFKSHEVPFQRDLAEFIARQR